MILLPHRETTMTRLCLVLRASRNVKSWCFVAEGSSQLWVSNTPISSPEIHSAAGDSGSEGIRLWPAHLWSSVSECHKTKGETAPPKSASTKCSPAFRGNLIGIRWIVPSEHLTAAFYTQKWLYYMYRNVLKIAISTHLLHLLHLRWDRCQAAADPSLDNPGAEVLW